MSHHLSGTRKIFIGGTYETIRPKGIEIADRSKIQALGRGDVKIGKLHLSNLLFVTQLGGNLLSVARLIASGYNIHLISAKCTITGMGIYVEGGREGNLYYL